MLCETLRESLAAHRHYEELRSKGIVHESALRQALALAMPGAHAVMVCGQGLDGRLRLLAAAGDKVMRRAET